MNKYQKLELTWIGKSEEPKLEPRILLEQPEYSYGDPNTGNMLIHGDNLLALKALEQDFAGKVKCIYIDPPYNTGTAFDKYDDGLEHSLWLSLIKPRLVLLKRLLAIDGIIWVSIDDHEVHYLKVLMDEVFGRSNFVASLPTIMNLKGNQDEFGFAGTHEYTLVYSKDIAKSSFYKFDILDDELKDWLEDDIGPYKKGAPLRATGAESQREDRPMMFYPILVKGNLVTTITDEEYAQLFDKDTFTFDDLYLNSICEVYKNAGWEVVLPIFDAQNYGRWRWGYNPANKQKLITDVIVQRTKNGISLYKKQRPELGELPSRKPKSIFYRPEYSSGNGTAQVKKLFGSNSFPYPKPEDLIRDFLILSTKEGDIILDSFLGSGTTAAVAHKMGRRWIGIELGPHAISHCFPRLRAVVNGEQGGVSKSVNWQGGGGFKFYSLAPSLLNKDKFGNWVISKEYNPDMLAAAMAKQEGFNYSPDPEIYWKQGMSSEKDYIFTTTQFITVEMLDSIRDEMSPGESLLIACKAYQSECENRHPGVISIKKIPQMLIGKCEFGRDDYSLNIINVPGEYEKVVIDVPVVEEEATVYQPEKEDDFPDNLFDQRP